MVCVGLWEDGKSDRQALNVDLVVRQNNVKFDREVRKGRKERNHAMEFFVGMEKFK